MPQSTIACPSCDHEFEISEALTGQIRAHLKSELQQGIVERERQLKQRWDEFETEQEALAKAQSAVDEEVERKLKQKLDASEQKLKREREALEQAQAELADKIEAAVSDQLKQKLKAAEDKAAKKAASELTEKMQELQATLEEREAKLKESRAQEQELLKQKRELEEAKEQIELEIARKLDAERSEIRQQVLKQAAEEQHLKNLEKDKLIADLKTALEAAKQKAEQSSMERQGEALELDLEKQLRAFFVYDEFQPVPKGIYGADLVHNVRAMTGADCGSILWEIKNTKTWSNQWIPKLKDDVTEARAAIAILVSVTLPKDLQRFGLVEGVWVSDLLSAIPLAVALREQLIALERERQAAIGKNEKMDLIYQYLSGTEFQQKISGIVDAFVAMQTQIQQERRAMEKQWKEREKQIERVIKNTTGLYGDMQGIIGGQIPEIPALELPGA
ncbi:MAG: DUF2130 domain-containing protein [Spirulinaceae cyanobacterium RM2_2_10]|nr:DUF2130 domain-containing protein [Spirulinaceae cyanobacterium SM2_1_0]NJO19772.1 DUF2130 domain-containing protein [Spirulinaceae cyanobacterium RM2_2_10]